jgi:putative ABC transport system permease protein
MWKDVALTLRALRKTPSFTITALLSLALGIGATTAIFSLLDQVILRSLPVRDPQSLIVLHRAFTPLGSSKSDSRESVFSYPLYRDLRDHDPAFSGVIARSSARVALSYRAGTEPASAEVVSGNFFEVLGIGAAMGRVFTADDDRIAGAHPVVVLSHSYWTTHFAGDPAILNQAISINGHPMTVIGVADQHFNGVRPGATSDLYVPIAMQKAVQPTWDALDDSKFRWLNLFARIKPGFNPRQAQSATDVVYRQILESELARSPGAARPKERDAFLNHRVQLRPAAQGIGELRSQWQEPLAVVMAMVGFVLLIACANVAALLLTRTAGRQREIAIRLALGATRGTLVKQLLTEGLVLFLLAGALGLLTAYGLSSALLHLLPRGLGGNWLTASVDFRLLSFTMAVSAGCGLLFGLTPALQSTKPPLSKTLKDRAAQVAGGSTRRFRTVMVAGQIALSLILLVGAALFASSVYRLAQVDLGFRAEHLLTVSVDATATRPDQAAASAFYRELEQRLSAMGNVAGVGASDTGPFSGSERGSNITVEGYRAADGENTGASMSAVSAGYFRAMGIPLRAGRELTERDDEGAPKVAVVNEAFAKRYFGSANPIGRRFMIGASNQRPFDHEIVGVVADFQNGVREPAKESIYFPYLQDRPERLTFYLRTASESNPGGDVRKLVRSMDPGVPVGDPQPMTLQIQNTLYTDRLIAILAAVFGVLATLLAAVGLYGVAAHTVARRTGEIGVRMALGAVPADIIGMILRQAGLTVIAGIVIGAGGALALGRLIQSRLFGVQPADPGMLAAAVIVLAVVALAASFLPAWRASRIDPLSALRHE